MTIKCPEGVIDRDWKWSWCNSYSVWWLVFHSFHTSRKDLRHRKRWRRWKWLLQGKKPISRVQRHEEVESQTTWSTWRQRREAVRICVGNKNETRYGSGAKKREKDILYDYSVNLLASFISFFSCFEFVDTFMSCIMEYQEDAANREVSHEEWPTERVSYTREKSFRRRSVRDRLE